MHPFFMPICSTLSSGPSQFAASSLHRQWVFTRNRTQLVQSHSVVHTLVFSKPPSCSKIFKYKISPKMTSRYLRSDGNWRSETPRPLWEVPMAGDAGTFEDYLWELLFHKNATPHLNIWITLSLVFIWELLILYTRCILSRKFFIMFLKIWSQFLYLEFGVL